MSERGKQGDDLIPAIKPSKDEVASYRRSGRSEMPRQSNFNGMLVFVIVLLSIMMGVGGYALWEVQQQLEQSTELLSKAQQNVEDLRARLSLSGDTTSRAFQDMEEQIANHFSEIDKLWGVSYRTNRPNIANNTEAIEKLQTQFDRDLKQLSTRMTQVSQDFNKFSEEMSDLRDALRTDNEEMVTQMSILRNQVQDQADGVESQRRAIATLERQMKEAEEAVAVFDQYRQRLNQQLLELRTQVQSPP